jgi:hypothetical protein
MILDWINRKLEKNPKRFCEPAAKRKQLQCEFIYAPLKLVPFIKLINELISYIFSELIVKETQ